VVKKTKRSRERVRNREMTMNQGKPQLNVSVKTLRSIAIRMANIAKEVDRMLLEDEVIWGILVCRLKLNKRVYLPRSEQVKTLLAGPSPISPMKAEINISPISNIDFLFCADIRPTNAQFVHLQMYEQVPIESPSAVPWCRRIVRVPFT